MQINSSTLQKFKEQALKAINKKAAFGEDLDLSIYSEPDEYSYSGELEKLPQELQEAASMAGVDVSGKERSGSFMQLDHTVIYKQIQSAYENKIEIMSITDALQKYPELEKYWWNAVKVDQDKYTAYAELQPMHGYFIRILKNMKIEKPIQACLMLQENARLQNVHNLIIAEEGSEAQIITGCAISPKVKEGLHIGVSEFYIKKDAKLVFTMIHNWAEDFHVRPRSASVIEDNATFISNYILLKPVKSVQMFPSATLKGNNSKAQFNSILYGLKSSYIDVGSKITLKGDGSSGNATSRAIVNGNSVIYARGTLTGQNNNAKAHLDCRGILGSENGQMYAIPELVADKAPHCNLSHEAAIGPIGEEEIEYLMARGLTKDEAISMITQGFMDVKILGLPAFLENSMKDMIAKTQKECM
jgi:Fe-S cluster assembly scaffold protein SufB